ncbi:MAG TPA: hypothetical protein PLN21_01755 [Gemmatales bacterium]|nr:hypothetical protein [Gemmatales bacterium]
MSRLTYGFVVLLITALLLIWLQLCGREENHGTTDIAVTDFSGRSFASEMYRVNWHQVNWVHGWPLRFLTRFTKFHIEFPDGTLDPTYNPVDERSWAVLRGVTWFSVLPLLFNIIICLLIAAAITMIVPRAKGWLRRDAAYAG